MICWYCHRPIVVSSKVKNITTDTTLIGANVRMTDEAVKCSTCGARYTVEVYLDGKPTVSNELLAKLEKAVIHP